jgi:hypothetical protein
MQRAGIALAGRSARPRVDTRPRPFVGSYLAPVYLYRLPARGRIELGE